MRAFKIFLSAAILAALFATNKANNVGKTCDSICIFSCINEGLSEVNCDARCCNTAGLTTLISSNNYILCVCLY